MNILRAILLALTLLFSPILFAGYLLIGLACAAVGRLFNLKGA